MPYNQTEVSASRSQEAIRKLLIKAGATRLMFEESLDPKNPEIFVWFMYQNLPVCFAVNVEKQIRILREKHPYKYEGEKIGEAFQQSLKSAYRFIFYKLKTIFEGIELGYDNFKEVFLANFEQVLPNGDRIRIGEIIAPALTSQNSLLKNLRDLPALEDKRESGK